MTGREYELYNDWRGEVKRQLVINRIKIKDLVPITGYSVNYLYQVTSGQKYPEKICEAISEALGIDWPPTE